MMNHILTAIVNDNRGAVRTLLKADRGLATRLIAKARLERLPYRVVLRNAVACNLH